MAEGTLKVLRGSGDIRLPQHLVVFGVTPKIHGKRKGAASAIIEAADTTHAREVFRAWHEWRYGQPGAILEVRFLPPLVYAEFSHGWRIMDDISDGEVPEEPPSDTEDAT